MDIPTALALLKRLLDDVPRLKRLAFNPKNEELPTWDNEAKRIIRDTFGSDSKEYARYNGIVLLKRVETQEDKEHAYIDHVSQREKALSDIIREYDISVKIEAHDDGRGNVKAESTVDFRELKEKLPRVSRDAVAKREELALYVSEAVMRLSGKSSGLWFCLLANAKGHEAVVDPRPTPDERLPSCWRGKDTWLLEDKFAQEVYERLSELVEDKEGRIRRQLKELAPPLTWGEVLCYFYRYLHENRHDETLRNEKMELDRLLYPPGRRYCFDCDEPFTVSKYHPYSSICLRCAAKRKQADWRAKRGKQSEKLQ